MKSAKKFCAFAAMAAAVVFAYNAAAENTVVDWSSVSGDVVNKTYTVPAGTTVVVGDGDIAEVMTLTKVIFSSADSVMKFTTSTFPSGVAFQGPGTALFSKKIELSSNVTLKRTLGGGDENSFVKFVFEDGIDNATPETTKYLTTNPSTFTNATIVLHGQVATNVNMSTGGSMRWNGRFSLEEDFSLEAKTTLYIGRSGHGVIRQRGGVVEPPGVGEDVTYLGNDGGVGAYLLEGGTWYASHNYFIPRGAYTYLRQTGGRFITHRFQSDSPANGVRHDYVFGGNGTAEVIGRATFSAHALFAFTDSTEFIGRYGTDQYLWNLANCKDSIWAFNGGVAQFAFIPRYNTDAGNSWSAPTNSFWAFNGGMRATKQGDYDGGAKNATFSQCLFGFSPKVRVYENGGGLMSRTGREYFLSYIRFYEPEGNVVKSIELSDELRNRVWQVPPSVEIYDEGGTGTNAAAVVDYDFDTGKITNITVMCKGENYSSSANVKANLRYKAGDENRLLETPLVCNVGPEQGGNFAFAATNMGARFWLCAYTNYMHGALVIDMDQEGVIDHTIDTVSDTDFYNSLRLDDMGYNYGTQPHFPNCTNFILKSGLGFLPRMYGWNHSRIWPNCWRAELYGGHLSGGSLRMREIVLGGEVWLCTRYLANTNTYFGELRTTNDDNDKTPGTMIIDAAYGTSVVKYGHVDFLVNYNNTSQKSSITVKNWEAIPKRRGWTTLLDLSETTVNGWARSGKVAVPDIAYPEGSEGELLIKWEMNPSDNTKPYKLLARRVVNGTMLIFR